jgi:hypothetical protein
LFCGFSDLGFGLDLVRFWVLADLVLMGRWRSSMPVFGFGCGSVSAEEVRCWGF